MANSSEKLQLANTQHQLKPTSSESDSKKNSGDKIRNSPSLRLSFSEDHLTSDSENSNLDFHIDFFDKSAEIGGLVCSLKWL